MRSLTVGMPSGRVLPSPFGISTRLTACGRYVPSRKAPDSSDRYSSAFAANRSTLCPSTPDAPLFARTFFQASASVVGAYTLSINEYHLPPVTPFSSADSMRSVHTSASTHTQSLRARGVSAPGLATSALPVLLCSGMVFTHPPSCPAFPRTGFASPSSSAPAPDRSGTMRALTPRRLAHAGKASLLSLLCRPSIPPPTTSWARTSPSHPRRCVRPGVATQASPWDRGLAAPQRRNGFVILRAARSPPVALHPASRRRSYLRLHVA